jgi:hypothetical protein
MQDEEYYLDLLRKGQPLQAPSPAQTAPVQRDEQGYFEQLRKGQELELARQQGVRSERETQPQTWTDYGKDIAGAFGAGAARGIAGLPGIVGTASQIYQRAPAYRDWLVNRAMEVAKRAPEGTAMEAYRSATAPIEARMSPEERSGMYGSVMGYQFPTSQYFVEQASKIAPQIEYQGKTPYSRIAGTIGEFVGPTKGLGAVGAATRGPAAALGKAAAIDKPLTQAIAGGAGAGVAQEVTRGTQDEPLATIAGGFLGAPIGSVAYGRLSPAARAEREARVAGDILRAAEPDIAQRLPAASQDYGPDIYPTTADVLRSQRLGQLEPQIIPDATLAQIRRGNVEALAGRDVEAGAAVRQGMYDLSGARPGAALERDLLPDNPLATSNVAARSLYEAIEQPAFFKMENAYKHPAFEQAKYKATSVRSAVDDAFKRMGSVTASTVRPELRTMLETLSGIKGAVSFQDIQNVKAFANRLVREAPTQKDAAVAVTMALDDLLTNSKNVSPTFMKGVTPGDVPRIFDEARNTYRDYKKTFETKTTAPLSERYGRGTTQEGSYVVPPEQFLGKVFSNPKQALQKYRELQSIPGLDVSRPVSDWVVSKLVLDDKGPFNQQKLNKLMSDQSWGPLIRDVPDLQDRLGRIAVQDVGTQLASKLQSQIASAADPNGLKRLQKFIADNKSDLKTYMNTPEQAAVLNSIDLSSRVLQKINNPRTPPADRAQALVELVKKGDIISLLHGRLVGTSVGALGGFAAAKVLNLPLGYQALELLGAAAGAMVPNIRGFGSRYTIGIDADNIMSILNRALVDPEFAKVVTQKPTIENVMRLQKLPGHMIKISPISVGPAALGEYGSPEREKDFEQEYREKVRPQRASGGRLTATSKADMIIAQVDKARRELQRETGGLLNHDDSTIVKALKVANERI